VLIELVSLGKTKSVITVFDSVGDLIIFIRKIAKGEKDY
jgi:hypothetical protein